MSSGARRKLLLVLAGFAVCAPASAEEVSIDSIVSALRSGSSEGTRGIRLPSAPAPAPVVAAAPPSQLVSYGREPIQPVAPARQWVHAAPRPVAAARAPVAPPPAEQESRRIDLTVQFANNSATLTPEAMRTLSKLGQALTSIDLAANRFRIEGHTDGIGGHAYNRTLSGQRAQSVVDYLVSTFGVGAARLMPVGLGADQPLIPAADNVPEPRNRRVTVVNIGS